MVRALRRLYRNLDPPWTATKFVIRAIAISPLMVAMSQCRPLCWAKVCAAIRVKATSLYSA